MLRRNMYATGSRAKPGFRVVGISVGYSMLTKLRRHFKCRVCIALYIASCSIINDQKSSAKSPFYLI
jgi:hypothetical protein